MGKNRSVRTAAIHLLRSPGAFAPHRGAWETLCQRAGCHSLFHSAEWLGAAWSYPGKPFLLAAVEDSSGWAAALTLCPRFDTGGHLVLPARALTILPHLMWIYPSLPVAACAPDRDPGHVDRLVAEALAAQPWDVLSFDYLSADTDWLEDGVRRLAARRGWHVESVPTSDEAWLDFPAGPEAYWAERSGSLKRKLAKATRELADRARITHEDLAAGAPNLTACFERFQPTFERTWQKGAGLSPFDQPHRASNLQALEPFFRTGRISVPALLADGVIIAFEFWVRGGGELFGIARGHDPAFAHYSIGSQLTQWTIAEAFRRGVTRLYLGPVNASPHMAYKERWLTGRRHNHRLVVTRPRSLYGGVHGLLARHPRLRTLWRKARLDALARGAFYALRALKRR